MPLYALSPQQRPDFWQIFGHSYTAGAVGTLDQTGRFDALFRAALDVEYSNARNHSKSGALLTMEGRSAGGWCRVFGECLPARTVGGPYAPDGGAKLFCFGINDLGILGTASMSQMQAAYVHAMRSCISRARASRVIDDNSATTLAYGAGFTSIATTDFTGSTTRQAITTTAATATITLPADYNGEPVAICFLGMAGVVGGTVTFSGTAGVTGTLSTSNIMPAATASRCPVIKRVTNLTSANASQTIICTVTALDASGFVWFDSWWLEAKTPPLVLVCNINKLTAAGYAGYSSWTGTEAAKDADVDAANALIDGVLGEFDGMVQKVPLDEVIGKAADKTFDGIHLNETGAGLAVDAMLRALRIALPPSSANGSVTGCYNVPSPRNGLLSRPRLSTHWYTTDCKGVSATTYTAVSGDMWAMPFYITEPRNRFINFALEAVASVTGTSVRWGVYTDNAYTGYPQYLEFEATSAGAFTITTGAGVKVNPTSPTAGSFIWIPDPGLYWLVVKYGPVGTAHTFRCLSGPSDCMPTLSTTGAPLSATTNPVGWKLTGQGTTAFPTTFPSGAALSDNVPYVGIKLN